VPDIATELKTFVTDGGKSFEPHYAKIVGPEISKFLDARMDQIRIYHALKASKALLGTVDASEAFTFQDAVLWKERSRQIAYHSQRDHTCHTLNNFILGWYIYQNSPALKDSFSSAFAKRKLGDGRPDEIKFGSTWIYVSLLHDIGYIFEGDFSKPGAFENNKGVKKAIECLNGYFDKAFWTHNQLRPRDRDLLFDEKLMRRFDISAGSMKQVSDCLQLINNLQPLLESVEERFSTKIRNCPNDAFGIWSANYKFFGNKKMSKKIDELKMDFQHLRSHGIGKNGPKILNHGVCSGLILLQSITYYNALYVVMASLKKTDKFADIVSRYRLKNRDYSIDLWWSGLVWATAAVAIHDRYNALVKNRHVDALSFADDPLAFLGILVDEMQLWDRFRVFDPVQGPTLGKMPTQSSDVELSVVRGKIRFAAPRHEIEVLEESLDERLADWKAIVFLNAIN
jgi:hypothetical protein